MFSILAFVEHYLGLKIPFVEIYNDSEQSYAKISIPFIDSKIEFVFSFIIAIAMWIGLLFYVVYFYTLKEFFKVFIQETTFSIKSLKRLRIFFYINLIPLLYGIVISIIQVFKTGILKFEEDQGLAIFHLLVAFLVYLYIDLFKKGKELQEENDLTI